MIEDHAHPVKPCPFCGGKAELRHSTTNREVGFIACIECEARIADRQIRPRGFVDAIRTWNARAGEAKAWHDVEFWQSDSAKAWDECEGQRLKAVELRLVLYEVLDSICAMTNPYELFSRGISEEDAIRYVELAKGKGEDSE